MRFYFSPIPRCNWIRVTPQSNTIPPSLLLYLRQSFVDTYSCTNLVIREKASLASSPYPYCDEKLCGSWSG